MQEVHHELRESWQSVGGLVDGVTYYSLLVVTNHAGGQTTRTSRGFRIDVSAPKCPGSDGPPSVAAIYDGLRFDRVYVGPTLARTTTFTEDDGSAAIVGTLPMGWSGFADWGAGIGGYAAAYVPSRLHGVANSSNAAFEPMGLAGSTSFYMRVVHAETYYAVVSVWDRLGNERRCYSDGVLYDHTPPNTSLATLASALVPEPGSRGPRGLATAFGHVAAAYCMQHVRHLVHATVEGVFDAESGVRQYYAAVGTPDVPQAHAPFRSIGTSEGEMLVGGLNLPDGCVHAVPPPSSALTSARGCARTALPRVCLLFTGRTT